MLDAALVDAPQSMLWARKYAMDPERCVNALGAHLATCKP